MKITIAKSAGFCFGVSRAINLALKTTKNNTSVYMLGDIVHNEIVIKQVEKAGIKKIKRLENGAKKTLLIRAHGASQQTIQHAKDKHYTIVDATCPMVKEIHKFVQNFEKQKRKVIIIGDKNHDEVKGIIGQLTTKPIVISPSTSFNYSLLKKIQKAGVVVQSTQNTQQVEKVLSILKEIIKNLKIKNTICKPTLTKQKEIQELPYSHDIVLVIGSKTSANTQRLYEIAHAINPNTYWVQTEKDLKKIWFRNIHSVAVTAGASTPESTIQQVVKTIEYFAPKK